MPRTDREVVARLGAAGLARALSDVLDHARLIRLANAVGISYPGMRTQSQKRARLVTDVADKAGRDDAAALAVVRSLRKETGTLGREWSTLSPDDRAGRLADPQPMNGRLGTYLFLAAAGAPEPSVEESLSRLLARMAGDETGSSDEAAAPREESPAKEAQRLRKKCAELQRKVRYLEGQIARTKDVEKANKRDLLLRKGELAEARMLAERLRRDLEEVRGKRPESPTAPPAATPGLEELERTIKRLGTEQRRLTHRIETFAEAKPAIPAASADAVASMTSALLEVQKDLAALRRERRKDLQDQAKRLDEVTAGLTAARQALETSPKAARSGARKKGEPERVGVFIDVQNMYYAARQLKGKLDFDALLQACVLDRRLIQATAYVVESKEIDQSGFIAMLQQRAIEVRRKTLKVRSDGSMKGDWDMEMALDVLDMASKLDVVVLVSGDGDFTSLVKRVKGIGPRVEVVAFPRNTAKSLLEAADRFHALDRRAMIRASAPPEEGPTAEAPAPTAVPKGAV